MSNLDVHVFVQARNNEDQTNINPATVSIELVNNLSPLDTVREYCTVMIPSGICSAVISIPVDWIESLTTDTNNVVSVMADLTTVNMPVNLGSLNFRYEATCPVNNNVFIYIPTYPQFSGSLAYVPVYAQAREGVNSFSIDFETGSLLEFNGIIEPGFFGVSTSVDTANRFKVSGSTLNFPKETELELLFTLVLSVKTSSSCTGQSLIAKIIFLSDQIQQSVSVCCLFIHIPLIYFVFFQDTGSWS